MIVSLHVSKTGGKSFRALLEKEFKDRLLCDYGDLAAYVTDEAIAHDQARAAAMRERRNELIEKYDVIHGHFNAGKYDGLFPTTELVAFFRDPYQQTISDYAHAARMSHLDHPVIHEFNRNKMTLLDYIRWPQRPSPQAWFLGGVPIERFCFIGLTEEFATSIALFNERFGTSLSNNEYIDRNPERDQEQYQVDPVIQREVLEHRAADVELYRKAKEIFARQRVKLG